MRLDGRRASTILRILESMSFARVSRSGGDAREAMTVGCKPTRCGACEANMTEVVSLQERVRDGAGGKKIRRGGEQLRSERELLSCWPPRASLVASPFSDRTE